MGQYGSHTLINSEIAQNMQIPVIFAHFYAHNCATLGKTANHFHLPMCLLITAISSECRIPFFPALQTRAATLMCLGGNFKNIQPIQRFFLSAAAACVFTHERRLACVNENAPFRLPRRTHTINSLFVQTYR